jgi:PAS domain S-box-containing protein
MTFRDLPIKRKVIAVIMLTTVLVLFLTAAAFAAYDLASHRRMVGRHFHSAGALLADNVAEALHRSSPADAENVLSALRANPQVLRAAVYDPSGKPVARYPARESVGAFPLKPSPPGSTYRGDRFTLFVPVPGTGTQPAILYLEARVRSIPERLISYSEIALVVLAGSALVAFFISRSLQRHISEPVLNLAETARAISEHGDLSVRGEPKGADEFGILTAAFNDMLQRLEEAERAHSFLAAIVESSDAAIIGKSLDGRIVSWNQGAERLFGYTAAEMVGTPVHRLLSADRPGEEFRILSAARNGQVCHYETIRIRKDGQPVTVSMIVSPIRDRLGRVIGVSSVLRDISERKRAQEQILKLNAELEQRVQARTAELTAANRELEAFTYSVAHDLRAPLRHIEAFSRILEEEVATGLDDEALQYLAGIRQGARNMAQLVDDLLNLTRVGRTELQRQPCPLGPLIDECLAELAREALGRRIEWRIRPLPVLDCDYRLMKQVLANLLSNAVAIRAINRSFSSLAGL